MNTATMSDRIAETSPCARARITGAVYLLLLLTGAFALLFVSGRLIVYSDAAATAANIVAHKILFRLSFAAYLVEMACNVALTALLYDLLKPVNKRLSLLAACFGLVLCSIKTMGRLFYVAPLFVLGGAHYLTAFSAEQLQALALLFLKLDGQTAEIAMVFGAFYCLLIGYLIFKSTFLPRILGVLMALAGSSFLTFLAPPFANHFVPYILALGFLAAGSLTLWLLMMGVNDQRWKEEADAAEESQ